MSILYLLILLGLVLVALYLYRKQYYHRSGEPPLFGGLPVIGHAISYGKNPIAFLDSHRKQAGDIFTLYIAGQRMTFVQDPLVFPTIFKNSSQYDFNYFARDVSKMAFQIGYDTYDAVDKPYHQQYVSFLSGKGLAPLTYSLQKRLYEHMIEAAGEKLKNWQTDNLFKWTKRVIFYGSGDTIFGSRFSNPDALNDFTQFDSKFAMFLAGLPGFLYSSAVKAHNRLIDRMHTKIEDRSTWVLERERVVNEKQISDRQFAALQTSILWAAQANTVPAAFWILAHVLADKTARKEVIEEIEQVMANSERDGDQVVFSPERLAEMVKLDSAISEALRLHSAPMMIRKAQEEGEITLTDGSTHTIRKGDVIMLSPYATHHDPEIYKNPEEFQYDRYMGDPKFYKSGQIVKTPLLPFGGGVSLCPGRHFARNEMKVFVAFSLYYLDIELLGVLPVHDVTRAGLGALPPASDVQFRYKLKEKL